MYNFLQLTTIFLKQPSDDDEHEDQERGSKEDSREVTPEKAIEAIDNIFESDDQSLYDNSQIAY